MTSLAHKIKKLILESLSEPEEIYYLYKGNSFEEMNKGMAEALYGLIMSNFSVSNERLINQILQIFKNIAHNDEEYEHITGCYQTLKNILKRLNKNSCNNHASYKMYGIARENIGAIIEFLGDRRRNFILLQAEAIIANREDLNIVSALIRDNKDILEYTGASDQNILWRLLKRYSNLPPDRKEEIAYLYQVITIFIINEDLNILISANIKYYLSALENINAYHVKEIRKPLEKKQKIPVSTLETMFGINAKRSQFNLDAPASWCDLKTGEKVYDFSRLPTCTVDRSGSICLDDAFSLIKNNDGSYTLYIHNVFIPKAVPYNSTLNEKSIAQIESLYIKGDIRTLYPERINVSASLLPGKIRHVVTGIWRIKPDFTLEEGSYQLVRGIIKNDQRLSFEIADKLICKNATDTLTRTLIDAHEIVGFLEEETFPKYGYRRHSDSGENKSHNTLSPTNSSPSADTIRNFGILNALSRMDLITRMNIPYIYVACDKFKSLDFDGPFFRSFKDDLRDVPEHIGGFEYYTTAPKKHYGLGCRVYGHVGSPLRISAAGQIQYIERDLIFNPNPSDKQFCFWQEQIKKLVEYYNKNTPAIDAFVKTHNQLAESNRLVKRR